jgi:hypothetical protein
VKNLKDKQDVNRLLHRAVDFDQVTFLRIEALKLRFSHDVGLSMALDSILDDVTANAEVLQELHAKIMPYSPKSMNELLQSQSSLAVVASTLKNRFQRCPE